MSIREKRHAFCMPIADNGVERRDGAGEYVGFSFNHACFWVIIAVGAERVEKFH